MGENQGARATIVAGLAGALLLAGCGNSEAPPSTPGPVMDKTCAHYNPLRQPFFGDLHVHTRYSLDASTQGTSVSPHDSYRFAMGEPLDVPPYDADGNALRSTQLARPLDFAAVTDHSEFFGETEICTHPEYAGYTSPECTFFRQRPDQSFIVFNFMLALPGVPQPDGGKKVPRMPYCGVDGQACLEAAKTPWADIQRAAEAYDDASSQCRFTTFVGYEWTGSPRSNNLHRNVIFRSGVVPALPYSFLDVSAPQLLWQVLADTCRHEDGCDYLTIPHNSNLSAGLMFQTTASADDTGAPLTAELAAARQANEPLAEIMQHKGQSECLGGSAANAADELCGFEVVPYNNLTGNRFGGVGTGPPMEQDYLRNALKEGLAQEAQLGANPFKYGFIGSTDTHIGAPGQVLENRFPGHGGAGSSFRTKVPKGLTETIEYNPGGLAVLWAEQNSRDSLFAAMKRREAYGTSGPRMVVRFFGGWDLPANACAGDFAAQGYAHGVPMGADLPPRNGSVRPRFAVAALRDPGAPGEPAQPLQRIQIIKGWLDGGEKKEKVFEVAGDPDNGASVDTATCETSGPGFASLCTVWEDPEFDAAQSAFYYARVVQNPSCRWSTYQCNAGHVDCANPDAVPAEYASCCDASYPKTVQERAWTSPIWYRPGS